MEVRAPHLSFMMLKEHWFRELYPDLKVTASFDRSESHTRVIDGQVRCITPEVKPQNLQGGSMMDRNLHVGEPRALTLGRISEPHFDTWLGKSHGTGTECGFSLHDM